MNDQLTESRTEGQTPGVTVVLTSCGRPDLLKTTLASFFEFNTYPVSRVIVIEDGGAQTITDLIRDQFAGRVELVTNIPRLGQIRSIDRAYGLVETEYIFHCEDDWEFQRPGFIEESVAVLESDPGLLQVDLKNLWELRGHRPERAILQTPSGVRYRRMKTHNLDPWGEPLFHGFSFNPGLRRRADYALLGTYSSAIAGMRTTKPSAHEQIIGARYYELGFRAAILTEGAVTHIGDDRHIADVHEVDPSPTRRVIKQLVPPAVTSLVRQVRKQLNGRGELARHSSPSSRPIEN